MCYSAQVEPAYHAYLRMTGAEMDYRQFVEIYGQRAAGKPVRIPRGFGCNFDNPPDACCRSGSGNLRRRSRRCADVCT